LGILETKLALIDLPNKLRQKTENAKV